MKTYQEWLKQAHPEALEEGWGRNLMAAGLMGMGALGSAGCTGPSCPAPQQQQATMQQDVWQDGGYTYARGSDDISDIFGDAKGKIDARQNAVLDAKGKIAQQLGGSASISGAQVIKQEIQGDTLTVIVRVPSKGISGKSGGGYNNKNINSRSVTSDGAGDFLNHQKSRSDF